MKNTINGMTREELETNSMFEFALKKLVQFDNFVNLTPHNVNIVVDENMAVTIPSSGVARVSVERVKVNKIAGINIFKNTSGEVTGLEAPENSVVIVSGLVLANLPEDINFTCVCPDSLVRNDNGQVVGCEAFRI